MAAQLDMMKVVLLVALMADLRDGSRAVLLAVWKAELTAELRAA